MYCLQPDFASVNLKASHAAYSKLKLKLKVTEGHHHLLCAVIEISSREFHSHSVFNLRGSTLKPALQFLFKSAFRRSAGRPPAGSLDP